MPGIVAAVTPINLLHDLFSPLDRIGDGAHRGGNPRSAVVLRQLPRCEHVRVEIPAVAFIIGVGEQEFHYSGENRERASKKGIPEVRSC